jgi:hypothetical protein
MQDVFRTAEIREELHIFSAWKASGDLIRVESASFVSQFMPPCYRHTAAVKRAVTRLGCGSDPAEFNQQEGMWKER